MVPVLEADSMQIVVRGSFQPSVITPQWLYSNGLVGSTELENSTYELYVPETASFEARWLRCQVEKGLLQLSTTDATEFERLRDVAVGILSNHSQEVSVMGVNRMVHFKVRDLDAYHAIGDTLSPKAVWDSVLNVPGMRSVTIWGTRPDLYSGHVQVQVEPSQIFPVSVFVLHNDHFGLTSVNARVTSRPDTLEITDPKQLAASNEKRELAIQILVNEWGLSIRRSELVIDRVASAGG